VKQVKEEYHEIEHQGRDNVPILNCLVAIYLIIIGILELIREAEGIIPMIAGELLLETR
jgi:hypothetical protein